VFEGRRRTYAEMNEHVNRIANFLQGMGVEKGTKVAILNTNSDDYVDIYYATARLGAIFVPVNYRAKAEELTYMLNNCEASIMFVGDRYVPLVQSIAGDLPLIENYIALESRIEGWPHIDDLVAGASADEISTDCEEDDITLLMYTSGTTAFPKGVILTHGTFVVHILATANAADPETHEVTILSVPIFHVAGVGAIMSSIFSGRTLVILRQFEPRLWLEAVHNERATHCFLVPTMLKRVMEEPDFDKFNLDSLQIITYGAATMPLEVIKKALTLFKCGFINAFGQTESTSTITYLGPEDHIIEGTEEEKAKKLVRLASIGKAMDDVEIVIMDEQGNILPDGEIGEIVARGPQVMKGYWKQEDATKSTIIDGWLHTGDMGWRDEDGYFYLAGRKKDMIIRAGENISPEQVEHVLNSNPKIEEAAVIGVPDPDWGERVKAVVVVKKGETLTEDEVIKYCKARLASYKAPEIVEFVDALPRNHLGKVLKKDLREAHLARTQAPA